MRNSNDDKLRREHLGQEKERDGKTRASKQKENRVRQLGGQEPSFLLGVGPDNTIQGIDDEYYKQDHHVKQQFRQEPSLFGQNQFRDGFGPVYAIPSMPWQHKGILGAQQAQHKDNIQWQNENMQRLENNPSQQFGGHHQANLPCCRCCCNGYRNFY